MYLSLSVIAAHNSTKHQSNHHLNWRELVCVSFQDGAEVDTARVKRSKQQMHHHLRQASKRITTTTYATRLLRAINMWFRLHMSEISLDSRARTKPQQNPANNQNRNRNQQPPASSFVSRTQPLSSSSSLSSKFAPWSCGLKVHEICFKGIFGLFGVPRRATYVSHQEGFYLKEVEYNKIQRSFISGQCANAIAGVLRAFRWGFCCLLERPVFRFLCDMCFLRY